MAPDPCSPVRHAGASAAPPLYPGLSSCLRCRRLIISVWHGRTGCRRAKSLFLWNPDRIAILRMIRGLDPEVWHRQGFGGPPCSMHQHCRVVVPSGEGPS